MVYMFVAFYLWRDFVNNKDGANRLQPIFYAADSRFYRCNTYAASLFNTGRDDPSLICRFTSCFILVSTWGGITLMFEYLFISSNFDDISRKSYIICE